MTDQITAPRPTCRDCGDSIERDPQGWVHRYSEPRDHPAIPRVLEGDMRDMATLFDLWRTGRASEMTEAEARAFASRNVPDEEGKS